MAAHCYMRNSDWKDDVELAEATRQYVLQNFRRREMIDFLERDFPQYTWSMITLSRRMKHFGIKYIEYNTALEDVRAAFRAENTGPGQLLGYRAMHQRLREAHGLAIPRGLVYDVMTLEDAAGLEKRKVVGKVKKRRGAVGTFTSLGPNHTFSADGHDKLMGFMNNTFPLAVYGWQDVFSGRLMFLRVWTSNSDPHLIGNWYINYLHEKKVMSQRLRLDKGTETGIMATIHAYLRAQAGDTQAPEKEVTYGPSTNNKIERWWRELHTRLEKFFKRQLLRLLEQGAYDPNAATDRSLLAFVFVPVVQKEMDNFVGAWNSHRVRKQKEAQVPKGIPDHLYAFPENYGAEDCGKAVSADILDEVAQFAGIIGYGTDYLEPQIRAECERIIPYVDAVDPKDAADTYLFLKTQIDS